MKPIVSVITPTYNRAHTLARPWNSLNRQSDALQIEWIIIDDGSTDDTRRLVTEWKEASQFPIIYKYITNGGWPTAVNYAKKFVSGDFVIQLDSDDCFKDRAFDVIRDKINLYLSSSDPTLGGVGFMCDDEQGTVLCAKKLDEPIRCSYLDSRLLHGLADEVRPRLASEITYLRKREYFDKQFYLEVPPPDRVPPHYAHYPLSKSYDFIYVDDIVVTRFRHDGISRMTKHWPRPSSQKSLYIGSQMDLRYTLDYFKHKPRLIWNHAINISKFGYVCGIPLRDQYRELTTNFSRILWVLALPFGLARGYLRYLKSKNRPHS